MAPIQPLQIIQAISALYVNPDKPFVGRIAAIMGITANGARNDASAATATLRKQHRIDEGLR